MKENVAAGQRGAGAPHFLWSATYSRCGASSPNMPGIKSHPWRYEAVSSHVGMCDCAGSTCRTLSRSIIVREHVRTSLAPVKGQHFLSTPLALCEAKDQEGKPQHLTSSNGKNSDIYLTHSECGIHHYQTNLGFPQPNIANPNI